MTTRGERRFQADGAHRFRSTRHDGRAARNLAEDVVARGGTLGEIHHGNAATAEDITQAQHRFRDDCDRGAGLWNHAAFRSLDLPFALPLPDFAAMRSTASSSVIVLIIFSSGSVAFTLPCFTYGP